MNICMLHAYIFLDVPMVPWESKIERLLHTKSSENVSFAAQLS